MLTWGNCSSVSLSLPLVCVAQKQLSLAGAGAVVRGLGWHHLAHRRTHCRGWQWCLAEKTCALVFLWCPPSAPGWPQSWAAGLQPHQPFLCPNELSAFLKGTGPRGSLPLPPGPLWAAAAHWPLKFLAGCSARVPSMTAELATFSSLFTFLLPSVLNDTGCLINLVTGFSSEA